MAKKQKPPVVVAELGRPETAAETSARKSRDSRLYRERKTVNNLVLSLLVSLGLVLVIFLAVPRGGANTFAEQSVNVQTAAVEASPSAGRDLAAPEVPAAWKAKEAGLRRSGDVTSWQINYTTVDEATRIESYAAVVQGFTAGGSPVDDVWVSQQLEQQSPTGTETLGGLDWVTYDHSDRNPDESNMLFGLQTTWNGDTILVYGTDSSATLRELAIQVAESLDTPKGTA